MSRPDEGLIHQWLDGECTPEESARLEALVASDPAWAAAVAEARGLIAASTRIVGALDAVPRALPEGSQASRRASAPSPVRGSGGLRVPRWVGLAAGVVLVAGTAYVMRERATAPFRPAPTVAIDAPSRERRPDIDTAPRRVSPAAPVPRNEVPAAPVSPPPMPDVTPSAPVPAPAPARAEAEAGATALTAEAAQAARERRLLQEKSARLNQAVVAGAVADAAKPSLGATSLIVCWRVESPGALAGTVLRPPYRDVRGDSLVVTVGTRDYRVVRAGDRLSGELTAQRIDCPPP